MPKSKCQGEQGTAELGAKPYLQNLFFEEEEKNSYWLAGIDLLLGTYRHTYGHRKVLDNAH